MSFSPLRNRLFLIFFCDVLKQKLFGIKDVKQLLFQKCLRAENFTLTALQSDWAF